MTLVSQAAFSKICNTSRKTVTAWKQGGKLVMEDGLVNVEATEARMKKYRSTGSPVVTLPENSVTQGRKGNKKGNNSSVTIEPGERPEEAAVRVLISGGADMTLEEAKRVKENYLALLNQLQYDKESGLVVLVSDVARAVGEEYAKARTRLLAIPSELAPRLLRIRTAPEMQAALGDAIHEALEELSRDAA